MSHSDGTTSTQHEPSAAFVVSRWLVVALPETLADALDRYTVTLGPEVTPTEAARHILQEALLKEEPSNTPAVLPHVS
jgi:hypothetical protein